jgi:hypothetical protein
MKINCDYFVIKCNMLQNSRGLTRCFFFNLESWWFCKYNYTIYNNILFRLYPSLNCVTSQFTISHILKRPHWRVCANSRSSQPFLFREQTQQCLCFTLVGQCCECFTSSQLSWAPNELGLWPWYSPHAIEESNPAPIFHGICVSFFHHMTCVIDMHSE